MSTICDTLAKEIISEIEIILWKHMNKDQF